jgi:succinyl-CoA synthetase beta subunit
MKIHEYQGKQIFKKYGVPVPQRHRREPLTIVVVKAQIHAGGRGKGGGVKLAKGPEEAKEHAAKILGMQLVTKQTGPEGRRCARLYIEQGLDIARSTTSAVVDRDSRRVTFMARPRAAWRSRGRRGAHAREDPHRARSTRRSAAALPGAQARWPRAGAEGKQVGKFVKFCTRRSTTDVRGEDCSLASRSTRWS